MQVIIFWPTKLMTVHVGQISDVPTCWGLQTGHKQTRKNYIPTVSNSFQMFRKWNTYSLVYHS